MRTRRFWGIVFVATSLFVLVAGLLKATAGDSRPRPAFPMLRSQFVAEYSPIQSSLAHNIYYHGLFGVGRSIRASEIVLVGSSRIAHGISAPRIARATGARVFNLALGCTETVGFGLDILGHNQASKKLVIGDALTLGNWRSPCGREAEENDWFQAYTLVFQSWVEFAFDWLVDPFLPRWFVRDGHFEQGRFLSGVVIMNDWRWGGAAQVWHPKKGNVYGPDVKRSGSEVEVIPWPEAIRSTGDSSISISEDLAGKVLEGKASLIVTLVPSAWSDVPADLFGMIKPNGTSGAHIPFLPIATNGLWTRDGNHLTYPSALIATDRLVSAFRAHTDALPKRAFCPRSEGCRHQADEPQR